MSGVLASTITMGIGAAELRSHDIASLGLDGSPESSNRGRLELGRHGSFVGGSVARASKYCSQEQAKGQTGLKRFQHEMFYHIFQKDRACRHRCAVLLDTKNFPTAPKANRCDFANGTTEKSRDEPSAVGDTFAGCNFAGVSCKTDGASYTPCPITECCSSAAFSKPGSSAREADFRFAAIYRLTRP